VLRYGVITFIEIQLTLTLLQCSNMQLMVT